MKQEIKQLTQREHVLLRPSMYCGSVVLEPSEEFALNEDKFEVSTRNYVPGLLKLFNEIIDNSIDAFIKSNGKSGNKISIKMTDDMFECLDNGAGIPNTKMTTLSGEKEYQATVAFTEMLSGNNYDNDDEASLGTNGIGSKLSFIFSKKAQITNDDGKIKIMINTKDNLQEILVKEQETRNTGVHTKIWPDLEYFKLNKIDDVHQNIIKERLLHLSISYPEITFKFNGKSMKLNTKNYFNMFNCTQMIELTDNISVAVGPSQSDQFEHFSLVNGLVTKSGGSHVNFITGEIMWPLREKLVKKYKKLKPADIKTKLRVVVIFRNFMNARYTSQTKEEITNSHAEIRQYMGDYQKEMKKLANKVQHDDDIMLPIVELFMLRAQAAENADLKKLKKTKKRIKSEKYLPATKNRKVLLLCEGASAVGGLMPALGREDYGYYEMRGVPLNAYEVSQARFTNNKELSELYTIIQNEEYDYIATATDADADGSHIKGLMFGFFTKYLPEYVEAGRFGEFNTPVQCVVKNRKITRWIYSLNDSLNLKAGESGKYMKGLGGWKSTDLAMVVKTDGIKTMLKMFTLDDDEIVDNWLSGSKSDARKEYLRNNHFDIAKV